MSSLIVRGLTKLAYRGSRAMGKWMKGRRANPYKGRSKRVSKRSGRRNTRKTKRSSKKTKRNEKRYKRKFRSAALGNPDRSHGSHTHGRPLKRARVIKKLLKSAVANKQYTIQQYAAGYRGQGALICGNIQAATLDSNTLECPLHLWELTGSTQGQATSTLSPVVFYKLCFGNSTNSANVFWRAAVTSQTATDTVAAGDINIFRDVTTAPEEFNMTLNKADTIQDISLAVHTGPGARGYLAGVSAKLLLNGPQNAPTKWIIQLVQLHEDVVPGANISDAQTAFWQAMIKPLMFSPLADGLHSMQKKYIKILKTHVIEMDAPESTEDHLVSRTKYFKQYFNLNRTLNFKWGIGQAKMHLENDSVVKDINLNSFSTHVEPKARVYLMIRAEAAQSSTGSDVLINPSYDYVMRFYHKSIAD